MEIKNKLTVTRGEVGGDNRGDGFSGITIKDNMDKTKRGWKQGRRWGWLGVGGEW